MKRFKPSAKPCVNCRKIKSAHKRFLGTLLCPHLISRRQSTVTVGEIIYKEMVPADVPRTNDVPEIPFEPKPLMQYGCPAPGEILNAD